MKIIKKAETKHLPENNSFESKQKTCNIHRNSLEKPFMKLQQSSNNLNYLSNSRPSKNSEKPKGNFLLDKTRVNCFIFNISFLEVL